jgi:hypothetical protein
VDQNATQTVDCDTLNRSLAALGYPFKLAVVPLDRLALLDKNARFMPHEMFKNLVDNIKRDQGLSSVPFCWYDGEKYHVLSGNHRVKGARAAGLTQILILYDDRPITRQEFIARQLSHNALSGKDDMAILAELWREIEDVGLKYYAGLDDKTLEQLADASLASLAEARLDFRALTFLFLPEEVDRLKAAFQKASETTVADDALATRLADFERAIDALDKVKASFDVKNAATALLLVLDVFERHYEDLEDGWVDTKAEKPKHPGPVPLASVLETDKVPAKFALVLKQLRDGMLRMGDIDKKEPWRVLERLVERYQGECDA